jgi:signal transduction histidine kinase/CheY-like chemotaxis protein
VPGYALEVDVLVIILLAISVLWVRRLVSREQPLRLRWLAVWWLSFLARIGWDGALGWILVTRERGTVEDIARTSVELVGLVAAFVVCRVRHAPRVWLPRSLFLTLVVASGLFAILWSRLHGTPWGRLPESLALLAAYLPFHRRRDALLFVCVGIAAFAHLEGFVFNAATWPDLIPGDNLKETLEGIVLLVALTPASFFWYTGETTAFAKRSSFRTLTLATVFSVIALLFVALGDRELRRQMAGTLHDEVRMHLRQLTSEEIDDLLAPASGKDSAIRHSIWEKFVHLEGGSGRNRAYYFMAFRGKEWWLPMIYHSTWRNSVEDSEQFYRKEYPWDGWMLPAKGATFVSPFRDAWGVLVTGVVGVKDAGEKGRLVMCVDVPALQWSRDLLLLRLPSLALVGFGAAAGALWLSSRSQKAERDAAELALGSVGHEVRTPLQSLIGYAELLSSQRSGDVRDEWTSRILSESRHLARLIRHMLDHTALKSGLLALAPAPTSPAALIAECLASVRTEAAAKGLRLTSREGGTLPAWLMLDATRVRQVVLNLLTNAIRYTPSGSVATELDWRDDRWLIIAVRDSGVGMSKQAQSRLFTPWLRTAEAVHSSSEGMGLGLSISMRIVGQMGGEIGVESELGQGSVFEIRIPSHVCQAPKRPVSGRLKPSESVLLLVEDNPELAIVFEEWVSLFGAEVHAFGSLSAAEQWLASGNRATHLLCDHHLPDGLGISEALERLAAPAGGWVAAVAISADDSPLLAAPSASQAWTAILQKPFSARELAAALGFPLVESDPVQQAKRSLFTLPTAQQVEVENQFFADLPALREALAAEIRARKFFQAAQRAHRARNVLLLLRDRQPELYRVVAALDRELQAAEPGSVADFADHLALLRSFERT